LLHTDVSGCASSSTNHQTIGTLFPTGRMFGDKCRTDYECAEELNLVCSRNELRTCQCRRGYIWNMMNKICYRIKEYPYDNGRQLRASFSLEAFKISTSLLPPWSRVLLERLFGSQLVKKLPAFYGDRKLIAAFTRTRHLSLSSARSICSVPPIPKSHATFQLLRLYQRISPDPRPAYPFRQKASFTARSC